MILKGNLVLAHEFIKAADKIALDVETTGLNTRKDKVIGLGLSDGQKSMYICHLDWNGQDQQLEECTPKSEIALLLSELLSKKLTGWNLKYDIQIIGHYFGVDLAPAIWSDGMLAKHTVDEDFPFGLKEVAAREYGSDAKKEQEELKASIRKNGGTATEYFKADLDVQARYCMQDCLLAYRLNEKFVAELERQGLTKFYFEDEVMPTYKYAVIDMEKNGIKVDSALLSTLSKNLAKDIESLEHEIQSDISPLLDQFEDWFFNKNYEEKASGQFAQKVVELLSPDTLQKTKSGAYSLAEKEIKSLPDGMLKSWLIGDEKLSPEIKKTVQKSLHGDKYVFNLLSTDHVKRLFFAKLKETPHSRTEKGSPQVNDSFLEEMAKKYEWARKMQIYRRLTKLYGTYYERIMNEMEDERFYPSYFCHRTTTGRQSGDFQQLPRPVSEVEEPSELVRKYTNQVRALFVADEGYKFLDADYNSLEVVVFADDSNDPALLDIINSDKDFYSEIAIGAYKLLEFSSEKKSKNFLKNHKPEVRQATKSFALGFRYGEDPYKLHKETGWPKEECDRIYENYFNSFKGLRQRMDELIFLATTKGYVQSKFGRKRRQFKAVGIRRDYGLGILDSLATWKKYHETPRLYEEVKAARKVLKSIINAALNFPIQSAAASIVSRAAWKLSLWLKNNCPQAKLVASIHDQLIVHCPDEHLEFVKKNMKIIMETTTTLSVPLTADPAISENLRDGH